jgi:hydroxymethylpyrimidine pyrophosphatase-like HAD family hydrolase
VTPPLVVDIDGTMTGPDRAIDPRVVPVLQGWAAPVVVATGKAFPYPVALCEFLGIPVTVIAENGGVVSVRDTDTVTVTGDPDAALAVAEDYQDAGYDLGWGEVDLVNRWRETELAVSRESPLEPLATIAAEYDQHVVDTGFAYHVKAPDVDKGAGLRAVADELGVDPEAFVAHGDTHNDLATVAQPRRSNPGANPHHAALAAADEVTEGRYGDGFLEAVERIRADE